MKKAIPRQYRMDQMTLDLIEALVKLEKETTGKSDASKVVRGAVKEKAIQDLGIEKVQDIQKEAAYREVMKDS